MADSIYGRYEEYLEPIMNQFMDRLKDYNQSIYRDTGFKVFEHLTGRIKSDESMREKCQRKGFEVTAHSALRELKDAIGIRIVVSFVDDIYKLTDYIRSLDCCKIVKEKDYIRYAKPNGYRSYHMIVEIQTEYEDIDGNVFGNYYMEIQLRTIAMDSWASLEHQLKYKKHINNQELIVEELRRCADELASCDVSMQTIRTLIQQG